MCGGLNTGKLASTSDESLSNTYEEDIFASDVYANDDDDSLTSNRLIGGAETLSDLRHSNNIPEVEIISLLEDRIPLYKLRVNTTAQYSYDHGDWSRSGHEGGALDGQDEDEDLDLTHVMMEETLKYFTLCGDRVVQMTKTYNDIDAVTKLLQEKEKDLELAAKIGQTLLEQNRRLDDRIDQLEEQLTVIDDQNTQLQHDLKLKSDLLKIYTDDPGYSDSDDDMEKEKKPGQFSQRMETLQKKVRNLEDENLSMRYNMADLRESTDSMEEKEEQLMQDCLEQLTSSKTRAEVMSEEMTKRLEENIRLQEENTSLLAQVVDLQQKVKRMQVENEELSMDRQATKEAQSELAAELVEMQEKYEECMNMLLEAQANNRMQQKRNHPSMDSLGSFNVLNPLPVFPTDSLAAELVDSVEQQMGGDPHLTKKGKKNYNRSVMKTVKAVNKRSFNSAGPGYPDDLASSRISPSSSVLSIPGSPYSDMYEGDNDTDSMAGSVKSPKRGIPGSNDLETALRRLELRKQNIEAERKYHDEHPGDSSDVGTPTCPTPDSFMSSLSGLSGFHPGGYRSFMPEKLQIVKPMEGSLTLHHWQRLAQPHMASVLDQRPGVMVKGFREIDRNEVYNLDDIEDDGQVVAQTVPSKCWVNTSSTYTFTNCNIGLLETTLSSSTSNMSRMSSSLQHPTSNRPRANSTKTFSTALGIAQVLNERNTNDNTAVKTKSDVSGGPSVTRHQTDGLNLLSSGSHDNEKNAEKAVPSPSGVHQVTGGIFSRNARPVVSKETKIKIMDKETKDRLLEKVRKIRATRDTAVTKAIELAPSRAVIAATRNTGFSMATGVYGNPPGGRMGGAGGGFASLSTNTMSSNSNNNRAVGATQGAFGTSLTGTTLTMSGSSMSTFPRMSSYAGMGAPSPGMGGATLSSGTTSTMSGSSMSAFPRMSGYAGMGAPSPGMGGATLSSGTTSTMSGSSMSAFPRMSGYAGMGAPSPGVGGTTSTMSTSSMPMFARQSGYPGLGVPSGGHGLFSSRSMGLGSLSDVGMGPSHRSASAIPDTTTGDNASTSSTPSADQGLNLLSGSSGGPNSIHKPGPYS